MFLSTRTELNLASTNYVNMHVVLFIYLITHLLGHVSIKIWSLFEHSKEGAV